MSHKITKLHSEVDENLSRFVVRTTPYW